MAWLTLSPRHRDRPAQRSDDTASNRATFGGKGDGDGRGGAAATSKKVLMNRLHLDGVDKYEERERAKRMQDAREVQQYPFKPKINAYSKYMVQASNEYKPIHERISELQRAKVSFESCAIVASPHPLDNSSALMRYVE